MPFRTLAALVAVLALLLPVAAQAGTDATVTAAAAGPAEDVAIDLEGAWRFATGDDPQWADPAFDDGGWEEVQVPTEGGQAVFADYDGYAWFRLAFDLPEGIDEVNLVASLGFIDDADQAFLNGVEIGRTGVFPPESDSQWFERRLYPIPAGAAIAGGRNVLAVRMNDFTGGGGWYRGPVGLFSKAALREAVYGIVGDPAPATVAGQVAGLLEQQAAALTSGDLDAFLDTLATDYQHDGRDRDRRARELAGWLESSQGTLTLTDTEVEVLVTSDGRTLVDTNRTITGTRDGEPFAYQPTSQSFLVVDPVAGLEVGNRSRFFRDLLEPGVEGMRREYAVYLPPSYFTAEDHRFPVVYLLHGVNGGAREWEPRDIQQRLDVLFTDEGLAESIVVMPDGESLWYIDSSATPWRTMFTDELVPQVDAEYRTLAQREFRGLTGVSMGGHGAFTIGWAHPELFSSIASHMGALSLPPLVGSQSEVAANTPETPNVQVNGHTPDFLSDYSYFIDACRDDEFRFGEAAEAMSAELTAKLVEHTAVVYPEGRHNDDCWVPHLVDSFGSHSTHFREAGLEESAPTVVVERVAGPDRVATAVAASVRSTDAADAVVIARADDFADAVAAGPLAAALDAPLLLSTQDHLPDQVEAEVRRVGATTAHLVGGEAALSPAVADRLAGMGVEVVRHAGPSRIDTAVAVASHLAGDGVVPVLLARADDFADALAAAPLAAERGGAILLSDPAALSPAAAQALADLADPSTPVVLAGGEQALSAEVADAVEAAAFTVDRRAGTDRYATAAALAAGDDDPLVVASGTDHPDALTAGVLAVALQGGLLLVDPLDLEASAASAERASTVTTSRLVVVGGQAAVSGEVVAQLEARVSPPTPGTTG